MRVFVTGASGFIGTVVIKELIEAGHNVLGMVRSDAGAGIVKNLGAEVHRGSLEDLESLKSGVATTDGVIHLAFNHDFSKFAENCATEARAVETIGEALVGTKKPFVVTSGLAMIAPGRKATEEDPAPSSKMFPRASETTANSFLSKGVNVSIVRLPQVHDQYKQGLVTFLIEVAQQKGVIAYVGEGQNRWPACHKTDAARVYRLALEKGKAGRNYHAVAEEGVPLRKIAETLGKRMNLPVVSKTQEEAQEFYGFLGLFASMDCLASSAITQKELGWHPTGTDLISDLQNLKLAEKV